MATAISTQAPSATTKMKPPRPPSLSTGTSGAGAGSLTSPSPSSKRPPQSPSTASSIALNNGMVSRSAARQRRESVRAATAGGQNGINALSDGPRGTKRKLPEPYVRTTSYILQKHSGSMPSLILHLHPTHFRFDQQDGSFGYNSPMKDFLEHLKAQTIPHDMLEELLNSQVTFYDGCLIIEVHDHKTSGTSKRSKASGAFAGDSDIPFSIHNYNEHLTPSPYVPYPVKAGPNAEDGNKGQTNGASNDSKDAANKDIEVAAKSEQATHRVFTTVMHPTEQSRYREKCILATTPMIERGHNRKSTARDMPTPLSAGGMSHLMSLSNFMPTNNKQKRQRMMLEEKDFHAFEAEYLIATEPPLLLDPADSFDQAVDIMRQLEHPLHTHAPAPLKARKRTATELAADEAQAAEEEQMSLIFDERLQPSLATGGDEGVDTANTARDFEPNFSRFKKLEEIRTRHEEEKKQKAAEAQAQAAKRQQQEAEARRQREEAERANPLQRQMLIRQMAQRNGAQVNGIPQQQQQQQQPQQAQQQQSQLNPHMVQQQLMQAQQAQAAASPIVRNQTPTNASSPLMANAMNNHAMAQSMSASGHGSPPRPSSSAQMRQVSQQMARQASQQQSQHGTPHMQNSTPQMGHSMPGRMTPQPGMSAGSPTPMQGTPLMGQGMMGTPQMNGQQQHLPQQPQQSQQQQQQQQMSAQQRHLMQQQMARNLAAQQQQVQQRVAAQMQSQQMSNSPNGNQFGQQMSPQIQQMLANQQQQQQHAQVNGQQMQGMGGNLQLTQQMAQQLAQQRQPAPYAQQMQQRLALSQMRMQQSQGQGQQAGTSMQQANGMGSFQQQQQGNMANGASMQTSMSQQRNGQQNQFMQGTPNMGGNHLGQMAGQFPQQQQGQGGQGVNNTQHLALIARQREQHRKNQFFSRLQASNNNMLPPNAHEQYHAWRQQEVALAHKNAQQMAQRQATAAAAAATQGNMGMGASGQGQGQGGGGGGGSNGQGGGGVDPAYVQQLQQQRRQMIAQQQRLQQQQQQQQAAQQRMMNGMPPGQ